MSIPVDFYTLTGPASSRQQTYCTLCGELVRDADPTCKFIDEGVDEGFDAYTGSLNGPCHAYRYGYYLGRLGTFERMEVERSLESASRRELLSWTLLAPVDLDDDDRRWFDALGRRYAFPLSLWGREELTARLLDRPKLAARFFMAPTYSISHDLSLQEVAQALTERATGAGIPQRVSAAALSAAADLRARARLRILLWGPGKMDDPVRPKRTELFHQLAGLRHEVKFSEEIDSGMSVAMDMLGVTLAEYVRTFRFDYIIGLTRGPNPDDDLTRLLRDPQVASRALLCVDSEHRAQRLPDTLTAFERAYGKLHWFEYPDDIHKCHLSGRVLHEVSTMALAKQGESVTVQ